MGIEMKKFIAASLLAIFGLCSIAQAQQTTRCVKNLDGSVTCTTTGPKSPWSN
jgi:hypothetical protein